MPAHGYLTHFTAEIRIRQKLSTFDQLQQPSICEAWIALASARGAHALHPLGPDICRQAMLLSYLRIRRGVQHPLGQPAPNFLCLRYFLETVMQSCSWKNCCEILTSLAELAHGTSFNAARYPFESCSSHQCILLPASAHGLVCRE